MQSRSTVVAALTVASAMWLAACSGGYDPTPTTSASTSVSSSTSTSSTRTTTPSTTATVDVSIPPEARKHTEAGAKAFARFFWEAASEVLVTNDASIVDRLASKSCHECKAFANIAQQETAKGHHAERSSYDIKIVRVVDGQGDEYTVSVAGNEVPVRTLDSHGVAVETSKPGVFSWATRVRWEQKRWLVDGFKAE